MNSKKICRVADPGPTSGRNRLLSQFAGDALSCPAVAGPVEAASMGNVVTQLMALGELHSLAEGRALVRRSFETEIFEPIHTGVWDEVCGRFQETPAVDAP